MENKTNGNFYVNWLQSENGEDVDHLEHFDSFPKAERFATQELPAERVIANSIIIIEAAKVYQVKLHTELWEAKV
ncbi:hypothetical protein [Sporomusa sp.]|uniref:hypothetical protein n=1 Tax=Sporomusa sp. TaxID=2078658 RepID=UPI002CAC207C|nr:hypothetical protein [Sporomusa sp.]HWR45291.1 hypothetical protein [Sporomusa sp.]